MAFTLAWPRILSFRDCKRARLPMGELLEGKHYPTGAWRFSLICGNLSLDLGVHLQKDARMRWPRRNLRLLSVALEELFRERWIACRRRRRKQLQTPPLQ